jgi:hypothetical protein
MLIDLVRWKNDCGFVVGVFGNFGDVIVSLSGATGINVLAIPPDVVVVKNESSKLSIELES